MKLKNKGIYSDSFAYQLVKYFRNKDVIKTKDVRNEIDVKTLRELEPINMSKKFETIECQLCMSKRILTSKDKLFNPSNYMNKHMEIFGACRHKAKIDRYVYCTIIKE